MRKSSSFMCVLAVLLAGGAEATRPVPMQIVVAGAILGMSSVEAWGDNCMPMKDIYPSGKELCEVMWAHSFEYTSGAAEANAYSMWWFEGGTPGVADALDNPNNAVATARGDVSPAQLGDNCSLKYFHKEGVSPEPTSFTECHPWHAGSCCSESTVTTPLQLNLAYGEGFEWDRCGQMSQACERFFVMEACFYECEPLAGKYRKYTDAQFHACDDGTKPNGTFVSVHGVGDYMCDGEENQWQMWKMPIKASFCDSWHRACAEDLFCGTGDYFACSDNYHAAKDAADAAAAEKARQDAEDAKKLPEYAIILIAVAGGLAILFCIGAIAMYSAEKKGKPIFTNIKYPPPAA